jgi:DNA primase
LLVLTEEKKFRCLSCGVEGDAITFVMKFKRCTFREAVANLSERCFPQPADPALAGLEQAARYYEQMLWEHPSAVPARGHLRERGIREETGRAWRLGYAPAGWTNLTDTLQRAGISAPALESAGLSVARPSGRGHYDRFRARLMIPIRRGGQVIAFGGRLVQSGDDPKYLNSPDTSLFHKSETLFGLDESAPALAGGAAAVVVEGFFDAIALHQAGVAGAVAVCGATVNETHLAALAAAGAPEVSFAFDGDDAGGAAAVRAAALGLGSRYRTTILECPEGLDPDELVQSDGAEGFRARLSRATPTADFLMEHEFRKLTCNAAAVEERVGALSRLASLFDTAGKRFTASQVERLAHLVGCNSTSVAAFLAQRSLLA